MTSFYPSYPTKVEKYETTVDVKNRESMLPNFWLRTCLHFLKSQPRLFTRERRIHNIHLGFSQGEIKNTVECPIS